VGRLLFLFLIVAAVYILWDRGTFGNRTTGPGPAQKLGESIDRGVAKAGSAIEKMGSRLEEAADHGSTPHPSPYATPFPDITPIR